MDIGIINIDTMNLRERVNYIIKQPLFLYILDNSMLELFFDGYLYGNKILGIEDCLLNTFDNYKNTILKKEFVNLEPKNVRWGQYFDIIEKERGYDKFFYVKAFMSENIDVESISSDKNLENIIPEDERLALLLEIKENYKKFHIYNVIELNSFLVGFEYALRKEKKDIGILMYDFEFEKFLCDIWGLPKNNMLRPYFLIINYIALNPNQTLELFFQVYNDYLSEKCY